MKIGVQADRDAIYIHRQLQASDLNSSQDIQEKKVKIDDKIRPERGAFNALTTTAD